MAVLPEDNGSCGPEMTTKEETTTSKNPLFASKALLSPFIPTADPQNPQSQTWAVWWSKQKVVLITMCVVAATSCILNLVTALLFRFKYTATGGVEGELFRGDCGFSSRLDSGLHAGINILSTMLLSASNLCMQLLGAPTRELVDKAHRNKQWLDVGIPSIRNFRHVGYQNVIVWVLLGLTSLPLHFLYNSAVYETKPTMLYQSLVVTPSFLTGSSPNATEAVETFYSRANRTMYALSQGPKPTMKEMSLSGFSEGISQYCNPGDCTWAQRAIEDGSMSLKLGTVDCLSKLSEGFGNRSGAVLVASYDLLNNVSIPEGSNPLLYSRVSGILDNTGFAKPPWLCGFTNTFDCRQPRMWKQDPEIIKNWNIYGWKIDYCLYGQAERNKNCAVKYSFPILIVVCCTSACKLLCICYTAYIYSKTKEMSVPLTNLGDAIQSFLEIPDPSTEKRCLLGKQSLLGPRPLFWSTVEPQEWKPNPSRWTNSATSRQWHCTIVPFVIVIIAGVVMLSLTLWNSMRRSGDLKHLFSIGIGEVDQYTLSVLGASMWQAVRVRYTTIAFANLWQFIASILYIQSNALLTCFCVEAEWQSYGVKRKSLRVFSPQGLQRSTYFVSIPLRYGLVLQVVFVFFHWILSQSVYLTEVESIHPNSRDVLNMVPFMATSPKAIVISILTAVSILVGVTSVSLKKHDGILPAGATYSAIISAACHRPKEDQEAHLFPVRWGEVPEESTELNARGVTGTGQPEGTDQNMDTLDQTGKKTTPLLVTSENNEVDEAGEAVLTQATNGSINPEAIGHCCFTTAKSVKSPTKGLRYE